MWLSGYLYIFPESQFIKKNLQTIQNSLFVLPFFSFPVYLEEKKRERTKTLLYKRW